MSAAVVSSSARRPLVIGAKRGCHSAAARATSNTMIAKLMELANTLFRRDGDKIQAFLVDAETSEIHPALSEIVEQALLALVDAFG